MLNMSSGPPRRRRARSRRSGPGFRSATECGPPARSRECGDRQRQGRAVDRWRRTEDRHDHGPDCARQEPERRHHDHGWRAQHHGADGRCRLRRPRAVERRLSCRRAEIDGSRRQWRRARD
jgi:hypothetical protein